ncbi:MAG TPA: crotonase [Thermoplasmatales archaeon]|nr:crotonase [Thermoplasmatales archaeon]
MGVIKVEKENHIAWITIDRPPVNALNKETLLELREVVEKLEREEDVRVAVITGAGKAFIAGADIKEMQDMTTLEAKEFAELGHSVFKAIRNSRIPYIAMVNGYALGGGCELVMNCDLVIASSKAILGQPEINLGICPGFGGTQNLPRIVGRLKAKELLLIGDNISAEEAERIGLVNKVVDPEKLREETKVIAEKIASKSPVQTMFIKTLVNKGLDMDLESACMFEVTVFANGFSTEDQKEGMKAFLEKREPVFKGR